MLRYIRRLCGTVWRAVAHRSDLQYAVRLTEDTGFHERKKLCDAWIEKLGFDPCDCRTEHGPDRTCPKCNGFGALPR